MTDSNRVRMTAVQEATLGTTPATPRMRTMRFTQETLQYQPQYAQSEEIRTDRTSPDPVKINETNGGGITFEFSYPVPESPLSDLLESLLMNAWTETPARDNDGTADTAITNVADTTDVVTVASGTPFVAGQLAYFSGFSASGNNGLFKCTTGSDTVPAFLGAGFTAEGAPPADARIKVAGFEGTSGDIAAVADGLTTATLDLTTLGLAVGQWIKIGGTGTAFRFSTETANVWARITAVAVQKLTLDNLPTGWAADSGAGKTIRVFVGDRLTNGTVRHGLTIERGYLGQSTPTYIAQRGMVAGEGQFTFPTEQKITGSITLTGMTGAEGTTSLDDAPDAAGTEAILSANANVGRLAEAGAVVASPNWIRTATLTINNNLRAITGVGAVGAVDIGVGDGAVTVALESYFGSIALLTKLFNGTVTNLNLRAGYDSQAVVFSLPRLTFTEGQAPSAGGTNQDVVLSLTGRASRDDATGTQVSIDRLEYVE